MKKYNKYQSIFFGRFTQKANTKYIDEIEWLILDETEHELLLLSKYCLDTRRFCEIDSMKNWFDTTWEKSSLRQWLNDEFYAQAFDEKEKKRILSTTIVTTSELDGDDIENKVFLLDKSAVEKYFPIEEDRRAHATQYAILRGASVGSEKYGGSTWWILPSNELQDNHYYPQAVLSNGMIQYHGRNIYHGDWTVRPAIRIKKEIKETKLKIEIVHGDILETECDAIVNPTNTMLSGSGGLDRIIHQRAGAFPVF